jgi:energy-coupling factor transporter ATP-binding protein EcfA2
MKKSIRWLEEEESEGEQEEELFLSPVEECLDLDDFGTTLICGSTESGKTTLVKHLIRYNALSYHKIYLLCSTVDLQDEYSFLPRQAILPVTEDSVKQIVEGQEANPNQRVAVIMDDCIGKIKFQNSNLFDHLASSCRHYRIKLFILIQDMKKLSPTLRDNCKVLFVTRLKEHSLKVCYELSSNFGSFQEFKSFMSQACQNYNVVRFDLTGKGEVRVFNTGVCHRFRITWTNP